MTHTFDDVNWTVAPLAADRLICTVVYAGKANKKPQKRLSE